MYIVRNKYNLFVQALETGIKARLSGLFRRKCKSILILFFKTMYKYCVYLAMSKSLK